MNDESSFRPMKLESSYYLGFFEIEIETAWLYHQRNEIFASVYYTASRKTAPVLTISLVNLAWKWDFSGTNFQILGFSPWTWEKLFAKMTKISKIFPPFSGGIKINVYLLSIGYFCSRFYYFATKMVTLHNLVTRGHFWSKILQVWDQIVLPYNLITRG